MFNYRIARLAPDMVSLAEPPRNVTVLDAWGCCRWPTTPGASTADKPFIHRRGRTYYLSWGAFYGVSSSVYGPYAMGGAVLNTSKIAPAFRTNTSLSPPGKDHVWFLDNDYNDRCPRLTRLTRLTRLIRLIYLIHPSYMAWAA